MSTVLLILNAVSLARANDFVRDKSCLVFKRALRAYALTADILEFVFDHTPSVRLVLLTVLLIMFALDVPLMLAFAVARYQPTPHDPAGTGAA